MSSDAERDVASWYLSRRAADPRVSIVRACHLSTYGEAWQRALDGQPSHMALDVPGLTAERVAEAERTLVASWQRAHARAALKRAALALDSGGAPGEIEADVTRALAEAASGGLVESETHGAVAMRVLESWVRDLAENPRMIPTPWRDLQAHTGGLPKGKLVLLGGRSSEHKTTTARELCEHAARHFEATKPADGRGEHALYWTLEDSSEDVSGRNIADNVPALTTRDLMTATHKGKRPTADAMERIAGEMRQHLREPWVNRFRILDESKPRRSRVLSVLSAHAANGCTLAVLDFFHLIRPDKGEMNPDAAREIASDLHDAAKRLGMCIIALGQLDKTATLLSGAEQRVPFAAEMLYGSMLKQTAFGVIMVGLSKKPGDLDVCVEKWKASNANMSFRLRVDPAHDKLLDA